MAQAISHGERSVLRAAQVLAVTIAASLAIGACRTTERMPRVLSPSVKPGASLRLHFATPRTIEAVRPRLRLVGSASLDTVRLTDVRELHARFEAQRADTLTVRVHNIPRDRGEPAWSRTARILVAPDDRVDLVSVDKANTAASVGLITLSLALLYFWSILRG